MEEGTQDYFSDSKMRLRNSTTTQSTISDLADGKTQEALTSKLGPMLMSSREIRVKLRQIYRKKTYSYKTTQPTF